MIDDEKKAILTRLDGIIRDVAPGVSTETKYGGRLYTLHPDENERQFCGTFAYSNHVQLSFARGAEMDDPLGILAGNGRLRRHINFSNSDDIDPDAIRTLIQSAIALDK